MGRGFSGVGADEVPRTAVGDGVRISPITYTPPVLSHVNAFFFCNVLLRYIVVMLMARFYTL